MKKILTLILAGAVSCSLCACGGGDTPAQDTNVPTQSDTKVLEEKKEEAQNTSGASQETEDKEEEKAE